MSGWFDLPRLNRVVQPECPLYEEAPGSFLLVLADFYPLILSFGALVWSFVKKREALALALSVLLWFDWAVSNVLTALVDEPAPFATCGCGHGTASPSFASQHVTVFVVATMLFVSVLGAGLSASTVFALSTFHYVALLARVYIGTNSTAQFTAGTIAGVVEGTLMGVLLKYTLVATVLTVQRSETGRWLRVRDSYLLPCYFRLRRFTDSTHSVPDAVAHELDALRHRPTAELPAEL